MKAPPITYSGGFIGDLSAKAIKEIATKFPRLSTGDINREAAFYKLYRDTADTQPKLADVRKEASLLNAKGREFYHALCAVSPALRSLVRQCAGLTDEAPTMLADLRGSLAPVLEIIAKAESHVPAGHVISPHEHLIRNLVPILRAAGEEPDKRPNGTLVQLAGIILDDCGEEPKDIRRLVERTLDKSCV